MNRQSRKKLLLTVLILVAAVLSLAYLYKRQNVTVDGTLIINDYVVTKDEYEFFRQQYKAMVASDFYSMYGIDVSQSNDAWDIKNAVGVTAREQLWLKTTEGLIRYVTILDMAREREIDVPDSFLELQTLLNGTKEEGSPFGYGIDTWNMTSLFSYLYNDIERQLMISLEENEYSFEEKELRQYYETMDKTSSAMRGSLTAVVDLYMYDSNTRNDSTAEFEQLFTELSSGKEVTLSKESVIQYERNKEISTETVGRDDVFTQLLLSELYERKAGEIFLTTLNQTSCICRILKKEVAMDDFEALKDKVYNEMVTNQFLQQVNDKIRRAKVTVIDKP